VNNKKVNEKVEELSENTPSPLLCTINQMPDNLVTSHGRLCGNFVCSYCTSIV